MEYKEVEAKKRTKIVDIIAKEFNMSKSEVKRLIKQSYEMFNLDM